MKLNVGCGKDLRDGWINLNDTYVHGMDDDDLVGRVEEGWTIWRHAISGAGLPTAPAYEEILCSHVLEHLRDSLAAMEALWVVAEPGCNLTIRCPHGASDDAWEDQTHVRAYFPTSFLTFGQPYYWRADYGYKGDWEVMDVEMRAGEALRGMRTEDIHRHVQAGRNMIDEIVATLRAVKPARAQERDLMEDLRITYVS
jgi:predicted SAM-dependent methyltransferase